MEPCMCPEGTAGKTHYPDCPFYAKPKLYGMHGWICPVCGRGNSPFSNSCPCIPLPPPQIWC